MTSLEYTNLDQDERNALLRANVDTVEALIEMAQAADAVQVELTEKYQVWDSMKGTHITISARAIKSAIKPYVKG
jgi:hypothetical protein